MYADYAYYTGTYKGALIPETSFFGYEQRAAEEIDVATMNRAQDATDAALLPSVKRAACAVADVLFAAEPVKPGTQIVSETAGGQSETRAAAYPNMDAWQKARDAGVRQAIRKHLLWTGLMYAGIGVC